MACKKIFVVQHHHDMNIKICTNEGHNVMCHEPWVPKFHIGCNKGKHSQ